MRTSLSLNRRYSGRRGATAGSTIQKTKAAALAWRSAVLLGAALALSLLPATDAGAQCEPDCTGKVCGSDGCGGSCGTCPPDSLCDFTGMCMPVSGCAPDCAGRECGTDGCVGLCGMCPAGLMCTWDGRCIDSTTCVPDCEGRFCGSDGCGGFCGGCPPGSACDSAGQCIELPDTLFVDGFESGDTAAWSATNP